MIRQALGTRTTVTAESWCPQAREWAPQLLAVTVRAGLRTATRTSPHAAPHRRVPCPPHPARNPRARHDRRISTPTSQHTEVACGAQRSALVTTTSPMEWKPRIEKGGRANACQELTFEKLCTLTREGVCHSGHSSGMTAAVPDAIIPADQ